MKQRKVKIIDSKKSSCIIMVTDMTSDQIRQMIHLYADNDDKDRADCITEFAYCNSRQVIILYDSMKHQSNNDITLQEIVTLIGYHESYDWHEPVMKSWDERKEDILSIIDSAVTAAGMKVLDGDHDCIIIRNDGEESFDFQVTVTCT